MDEALTIAENRAMRELNEDDRYEDSDLTIVELACACVFVAILAVVIALTALGISIWGLVHD